MRPALSIRGVRCCMFMPQLRLSDDTLNQLREVIPGWVPSIIDANLEVRNGIYTAPLPWAIVSPDGKERIVFAPMKVDYLFFQGGDYTHEEMTGCINKCITVFNKILSISNTAASRLAFAPAYVLGFDEESYKTFIESRTQNPQFKGRRIEEANFTQTFFVEEEIRGSRVMMNYLSKFETERYVDNVDGRNQLLSRNTLEFDINTREDNSLFFTNDDVTDFFGKALQFNEDYLDYYFA